MAIDYEKESKEVMEAANTTWWRPPVGTHTIKILSEPEESSYTNPSGETTPQINMDIEVNGNQMKWSVTKAATAKSLYGQLMLLGKKNGNKLKDLTFDLKVAKDGLLPSGNIKRSYTIPLVQEDIEKSLTEETVK